MRTRAKRILNIALAAVLTLCLAAGSLVLEGPAYAASEFKTSTPFSNTGRSTYKHNGRFSGNLIVNGVDISAWQSKKCDFAKAKAAGVDFAILRVSFTYSSKFKKFRMDLDENFAEQYKRAKAAGVMTGVYVFSQAKTTKEAIAEANFAIKRLKALGIGPEDLELPLYMDYEFSGGVLGRLHGIKKTASTNAAVAFCNTVKAAGYTPGIYANTSFFSKNLKTSQFASDVDLWCAQYYSRCESGVPYTKWQYSSSARINGLLSYTGKKGNIDVNFWYLNKKISAPASYSIKGKTTLSVKDAKAPKFKVYNGKTELKQGKDYIVGGIRNNKKGNGYAYIKGIGNHSGYALVPIKITDKTEGKDDQDLTKAAANYLRAKNNETSKYISTSTSSSSSSAITYKVGKTYTIQTALNIRKGPGTNYSKVKRSSLSSSMKKKTYSGKYAVLKTGKKVECKKVSGRWIKISGGWVCTGEGNEIYVK